MKFFSFFGSFLLNFIFRFSLFFGLTLLAAVLVLTDPEQPKNILKDVNAHQRFTQAVIDTSAEKQEQSSISIPLDNPEIKAIIKSVLDEKTLTDISNMAIDGIYRWLDGDSPDINFAFDLSANKEKLAENISTFAVNRIAQLEVCIIAPVETDVFKIPCNPIGTDLESLKQTIKNDILNDKSILESTNFSSANLPKNEQGKTIVEEYKNVPAYYQIFKIAPYILLGIALICATIILFSSRTKRVGFKKIGASLVGTAVIMAISPLIYVYILPMLGFKAPSFGGGNESFASIVNDAMSQLYSNFNVMLLNVAFQVALVGVIILIITSFIKKNSSIYSDIDRKAGLSVSESKSLTDKKSLPKIPLQTSEGGEKKSSKKSQELAKKYKKL